VGISSPTPDSAELLSQFLNVITELIVDLLQRCLQARLSLPGANWREHDRTPFMVSSIFVSAVICSKSRTGLSMTIAGLLP